MSAMESLTQDLRSALRTMRRNRGLTAVVVLSAGLAIGANTAVFSVVDAFLLRPLAIEDIDRVVRVRENLAPPGHQPDLRSLSAASFGRWQRENQVFSAMAAATGTSLTLTGEGGAERISGARVSASFFPVLGIRPLLGRIFSAQEDRPGREDTVLLGYGLWQRRFAGDPKILGRVLALNGTPHTVLGVMPRGLRHPYEADLWVPLGYREDAGPQASAQEYYAPARLKPGITLERARDEMNALARRFAQEDPHPTAPRGADLSPLRGEMIGNLARMLYLLSAAAAFVLLIACANISNLLLAQSLDQRVEVAVRTALGAGRGRLIRQFLTYSVVLAVAGGLAGLLLSSWAVGPLAALSPVYGLGEFDIQPRLDLSTLGFTFLVSLVVGVIFGVVPALKVSKVNLVGALKEGGRSRTMSAGSRRLLAGFVTAEVALALMLLVGAGLMFRSLQRLRGEDRGFDRRNLLTFTVAFPDRKFPRREQKVAFLRDAVRRLRDVPGAVGAGATTVQPLYAGTDAAAFNVEGHPATEERGFHITHTRTVTPGYFEAMKIPLVAGRYLDEHDDERSPLVIVISKSFADRYWPGESAVGKRVKRNRYDSDRPWLTVVGVVGTLKETEDEVATNSDAWYLPYAQPILPGLDTMTFVLRSRSAPEALLPAARAAIASVDRDQPIYDVKTMEDRFQIRTQTERFSTGVYGALGLLGLTLAAIGIYAVLAFSVSQRLPEIGIRSALGATPGEVRILILRNALLVTALGLALGAGGALLLTKLLSSELYQVDPRDPATFLGALACLAATALAASVIPAYRAAKVSPLLALRHE
jgi:putative ABC transport system permease protein